MILNNVITNKTQRNVPAMLIFVELIIMLEDAVHGFIPYGRFSFIAQNRVSGNSFFLCLFEADYSLVNSKTENSQIFRQIFGKVWHMLAGLDLLRRITNV